MNWAQDGWMVPVGWHPAPRPLRTKNLITDTQASPAETYSPLNPVTGNGAQNISPAGLTNGVAGALLSRLGTSAEQNCCRVAQGTGDDDGAVREVDDALKGGVRNDPHAPGSNRSQTGQGLLPAERRGGQTALPHLQTCPTCGCLQPQTTSSLQHYLLHDRRAA